MSEYLNDMRTRSFRSGQWVKCIYHWTLLAELTGVSRPSFIGRILFRLPWRRRHLFSAGPCNWYIVLFRGWIPVIYPATCMEDLLRHAEHSAALLAMDRENGYDPAQGDAYNRLLDELRGDIAFIHAQGLVTTNAKQM